MLFPILGYFLLALPVILFFIVAWKDGYLECAVFSLVLGALIIAIIAAGLYLIYYC
jgi:hypothetical protein